MFHNYTSAIVNAIVIVLVVMGQNAQNARIIIDNYTMAALSALTDSTEMVIIVNFAREDVQNVTVKPSVYNVKKAINLTILFVSILNQEVKELKKINALIASFVMETNA